MSKADAIKEAIELAKKTKQANSEEIQDSDNQSVADEVIESLSKSDTTKKLSRD